MKSLVIAPHPDDEVLGPGGTLLRRKHEGGITGWLIMSEISESLGWNYDAVDQRKSEIRQIKDLFEFDKVFELAFPTTNFDQIPMVDMVTAVSKVIQEFAPEEVFVPHYSDIHSDHRITFDVVASCIKWFRCPSVKRVLAFETLSETDYALIPGDRFKPNFFVNIEDQLELKLKAADIYKSEFHAFPFPRSREAIIAQARLRGSNSGFKSAEAFELLREIV